MICPECGVDNGEVERTIDLGRVVYRQRKCDCGNTWKTRETRLNATLVGSLKGGASAIRRQGGGVSVSEKELKIPEKKDPDPEAISPGNPIRAHARDPREPRKGRGDALRYDTEFEAIWQSCKGRRGNKLPAFKAWVRHSRLSAALICQRWAQWMETGQFKSGAVPHLSSWLNDRGWETEPTPEELKPWTNGRSGHGRYETAQQAQQRVERERAAEAAQRTRNAENEAQRILARMEAGAK